MPESLTITNGEHLFLSDKLLGLRSFADLKEQNPEALYEQFCVQQGTKVDRCMLYVFRCAIYFVSHDAHDAHLLLWWNWKDEQLMKPPAQA